MKKTKIFLLSFLLSACSLVADAQSSLKGTIPSGAGAGPTGATSVSSNGVTAVYLYVKPALPYRQATFQVKATRVSSAMNGTVLIQGSTDGVNYFALSASDSIHIANGATDPGDRAIVLTSGGTSYPNQGLPYAYYRLKCTQQAGDTATVVGWFYGRE